MFKISAWFAPLARRLLYAWVKATVFAEARVGHRPGAAGLLRPAGSPPLQPAGAIRGEQARRLPPAELPLVVGEVRARRSAFFLNRRRASLAPRCRRCSPGWCAKSCVIRWPTQIVPVLILWGVRPTSRSPSSPRSSPKPGAPLRCPAPVLRRAAARSPYAGALQCAALLRELVHGGGAAAGGDCAAQKVSRVLQACTSAASARWRSALTFPPQHAGRGDPRWRYRARRDRRRCDTPEHPARCGTGARPQVRARDRLRLQLRCRARAGAVLSWLWGTFLYDGIEGAQLRCPDPSHRGGASSCPCHRSHIDYLLLSHLIHKNGMTPLHRRRCQPQHATDRRAAALRRRLLPAPQLQGRTTLCGGLPRIPAPDAGARLSDRVTSSRAGAAARAARWRRRPASSA